MTRTDRQILHIALPSIVSNITVPLLGLIDVSIVGHLGAASYIGAIAVGGMLFNMIYWLFGFLRMGTGGLTAQAYGRHDLQEVTRILLRSLSISLLLSLALLLLQYPIRNIAFMCMDTSEEVRQLATLYFHICIWGAPATLGLYGFTGWYIGMQNSRFPMFIAITQNIVNIAASLFFVFVLKMKVEGVALGTLVAQYAGLGMACLLWLAYYRPLRKYLRQKALFDRMEMKRFFQVNRDIFFRTLCLIAVTVDAAVHALFLFYGRICLRGRGTDREIHRGQRRQVTETDRTAPFQVGLCVVPAVYLTLWSRRKRFSRPADRRRIRHFRFRRIHRLGVGHSAGRIFCIPARRNLHRSHSYPRDAPFHADCFGQFLSPLLRPASQLREPCLVDGFHCLSVPPWNRTRKHTLPDAAQEPEGHVTVLTTALRI